MGYLKLRQTYETKLELTPSFMSQPFKRYSTLHTTQKPLSFLLPILTLTSSAIPALYPKPTLQLGFCIQRFRWARISLIFPAEQIQIGKTLSTSGLSIKIKIRVGPLSCLDCLWNSWIKKDEANANLGGHDRTC